MTLFVPGCYDCYDELSPPPCLPFTGGQQPAVAKLGQRVSKEVHSVADLERLLQEYKGKLSHIDMCAATSALARFSPEPRQLQLAQQLTHTLSTTLHPRKGRPLLEELDTRGQASILWAWAKMRYWPDSHFMQLLSTFTANARTSGATPRELSNVAWALYQAWRAGQDGLQPGHPSKHQVQEHMQKLQAACVPVLREMNFQDMSNLLLAAKGTGVLDDGLAPRLLLHIQNLLSPAAPEVKSQELSNSLWCLASMGRACYQELLLDAARAVRNGCMQGAKPQEWSDLLWALSTLGLPYHHSQELARYVAEQVVQLHCLVPNPCPLTLL